MGPEALVAEVRAVLGAARRLIGAQPHGAGLNADAAGVALQTQHDAAAGQWYGHRARSYGLRTSEASSVATRIGGADAQITAQQTEAATTAADTSAAISRIEATSEAGVAALAPTTDTAAGKAALTAHLRGQLDAVRELISDARTRDVTIGQDIRAAADGYPTMPRAHVDPKPPRDRSGAALCWIGTENGDIAAICPPNTEEVSYVDDEGRYVSKNLRTGEVTVVMAPGTAPDAPTVCWLPSPGADRSICGPATTSWIYPQSGYLITEQVGPDGHIRVTYRTPLGPLIP